VIGVDVDVDVDVVDPLFAEILTKAKAEVDGWEGKLYFVYLPMYARYKKSVSHDDFRRKSEVIEVVKGLGIPVVDIHQEVFADHLDPLVLFPFRLPGHYNADGYSEVAKAIVISVNKYEQSNK
jgi:lysophospholipase L1-like esterase